MGGQTVILWGVGPAGEVSAHAEVGDGDAVVLEVERDEASDFTHRSVAGESPVHLLQRARRRVVVCVQSRRVGKKTGKTTNTSIKRSCDSSTCCTRVCIQQW